MPITRGYTTCSVKGVLQFCFCFNFLEQVSIFDYSMKPGFVEITKISASCYVYKQANKMRILPGFQL